MKKRIIAIIIAATMSLGLMACGADNKKAEATEIAEEKTIHPVSYDDFNINDFGYSNYIDLYGAGKILCGVDDELKNKSDVFKIEKI